MASEVSQSVWSLSVENGFLSFRMRCDSESTARQTRNRFHSFTGLNQNEHNFQFVLFATHIVIHNNPGGSYQTFSVLESTQITSIPNKTLVHAAMG